jgi:predicted TIM-barrel fold metal-dependent hydrolase
MEKNVRWPHRRRAERGDWEDFFDKIMYGSDGFGISEISWFAAVQGKRSVGSVPETSSAKAGCYRGRPKDIARNVFSENATRVYRLDGWATTALDTSRVARIGISRLRNVIPGERDTT